MNELVIRINANARDFRDELNRARSQTRDFERTLSTIARRSAIAFAGFATAIAGVTTQFSRYETALVGVGKTTNIEGRRLRNFGREFQRLASEIPVSTTELLGIAQAAGQLGVEGEENLLVFTETIAKLGVATDLTGEQAATALTRILNVTNESISTIDNFGSVIVALGNNFAATESEIVRMTTEVARGTAIFGVSAAEAAALATSLRSVGVRAELGGSVVSRAFRTIETVIRNGGQNLQNLATITGQTGDQLRQTFETDALGVFQSFIGGLNEVEQNGGSVAATLESFGLRGDEINKVLPVLAQNSELFARALNLANAEVTNATALNEEAERAFSTLASEAQIVRNNFSTLAENIGEQLAPSALQLLQAVNGLLTQLNSLDTETVSVIATFLRWGAIITGAISSAAVAGAAFLRLRGVISALRAVFTVGRVAAIGFTGALTGGLSLIIGFLPEIIDGFRTLLGLINRDEEPQSLQAVNEELEKLRNTREQISNIRDPALNNEERLRGIDEEIQRLEQLRTARLQATEGFGDGSLLMRPEAQPFDPSQVSLGIEEQEIPLRPAAQQDDASNQVEQVREGLQRRQALIDEATQQRIDAARRESAILDQIQQARIDGASQQEQDFLRRRLEIEEEFAQAEQIQNEQERQAVLDNLALQHAEELQAINEFEDEKDNFNAMRAEERAALDEELRQLDVEQQNLFNDEDLARLQSNLDTQEEAERKFAEDRLKTQIAERNRFKQDELRFGTEIARAKQLFNSQEVQGFRDTSQQLAQLSQSRNSTLKSIGKAAARVNAAIKTAEGAIAAYTSLAGIPFVGPALGAAAAAAVIAFGVEQQQRISSAQTGGIVPNAIGGARDRVPMLLEPGELVVPRPLVPNFTQAAGIPDAQSDGAVSGGQVGGESGGPMEIDIRLEDRAGEFISLEQREGRALGTIAS